MRTSIYQSSEMCIRDRIRVGYRTQKTGEMCVDTNARDNMQEAQKNGIKVGVYFFSSAVNETEAIEEADWVADYLSLIHI